MIETTAEKDLSGYRPHLDGLRAVAVYLVVLFHAGSGRFEGGFIGVDVFFVLSGFLVTRVLVTSQARGDFRLRTFYARRVRRLLPGAVVAVVGIAWLWSLVVTPAELLAVSDGFTAALLYFANWFFIVESTDYFGPDLEASPVLHFWSLAIEEQFYLLWPLLLLGLTKLTGRFQRSGLVQRCVVGTAALASLLWALYVAQGDLNRAYYGTDTRAYQLLAGAALALSAGFIQRFRRHRSSGSVVSVGAALLLFVAASSLIDVDPIWRGVIATVLTLALLVSLETGGGPVKQLLSLAPVSYLGQISYGTYLWHWPLIVVLKLRFELSATSTFLISAVLATGVAALSSRLVELPIRDSAQLARIPRGVVASGLAISLVAAVVAVPALVDPDRSGARNSQVAQPDAPAVSVAGVAVTPPPDERILASTIDWQTAAQDKSAPVRCTADDVTACTVVEGAGKHVMLVGDSHAIAAIPIFQKLAEDRDLTLSLGVEYVCAWPEGMRYNHESSDLNDDCDETRAHWYETLVPQLDPDVIVTILRSPDDVGRPVPIEGAGTDPVEIGRRVSELAAATLERLSDDRRTFVLMEPIPVTRGRNDPLKCLSGATYVDECTFVASAVSELERSYREWADDDDSIYTIDSDALVCPGLPACEPVVDGIVVRWDDTHLTRSFALSIADELGDLLEEALEQ